MDFYKSRVDFGNWIPEESQKDKIVNELYNNYLGILDNCGDGEEADEAFKLYLKVKNNSISKYKKNIQNYFADCYFAVNGEIEEYYKGNEELIRLIKLTVF